MNKTGFENAKKMAEDGNFAQTRADSISDFQNGNHASAGLFLGLVSAPRRMSHAAAWADVSDSAHLLNIEIPENIRGMKGIQAAQQWEKFLREGFSHSWEENLKN